MTDPIYMTQHFVYSFSVCTHSFLIILYAILFCCLIVLILHIVHSTGIGRSPFPKGIILQCTCHGVMTVKIMVQVHTGPEKLLVRVHSLHILVFFSIATETSSSRKTRPSLREMASQVTHGLRVLVSKK